MKIAHLTGDGGGTGGISSYLVRLIDLVKSKGHDVILFDIRANGSTESQTHADRYYPAQIGTQNKKSDLPLIREIVQKLEIEQPDIVHVHGHTHTDLDSAVQSRFPSVKSFHGHDFCPSGSKYHHLSGRVCQHRTSAMCVPRMGYKRCLLSKRPSVIVSNYMRTVSSTLTNKSFRSVIVGSYFLKNLLVREGYGEKTLHVIPYFMTLPALSFQTAGAGNILFIGRILREKGLDHLLKAFALLRSKALLRVVGDGNDLPRARRLAHELRIEDRVCFLGSKTLRELEQEYRDASFLVVPSLWPEPFGLVGIDVMSYGKPVVAYKVGAIPEWLKDKETGYLVEHRNIPELALKMQGLLDDANVRGAMGQKARAWVEERFHPETHYQSLLRTYQNVMS